MEKYPFILSLILLLPLWVADSKPISTIQNKTILNGDTSVSAQSIYKLASWIFNEPEPDKRLVFHNSSLEKTTFQPEDAIKLLVWNIHKEDRPSFLTTFEGLLEESNLILLQETLLTPQILELYENSDFSWMTGISFFRRGMGTGVSGGFLFETKNAVALESPSTEPFVRTPKMSLFFDIPIAGSKQVIKVITIHALNFVRSKTFAKHIAQVLKQVEDHNGPLIFAGDFNDWSRKKSRMLQEMIESHNLQKVIFDKNQSTKIDHIFIRGFEVVHSQIVETNESDHKPLMTELRLLL